MLLALAMCAAMLPVTAMAVQIDIYVESSDDTYSLDVESLTISIQKLKETIYNELGYAIDQQELYYGEKYLYSEEGLQENGIQDGSTLRLVLSSYVVSLAEGLSGEDTATYGTDYTGSIDNFSTSYDYTVSYTVGGGSEQDATVDSGTGEFTIDGFDITGRLEVTLTATEIASHTHTYDTNGFCDTCSAYQSATLNGSTYEISNAGQLFWFAALVNGDTTQEGITAAVSDADAILTADINLESKEWTPIGDYAGSTSPYYCGTFDGKGYTISNLYINNSASNYQGLFGYVSNGTVQNVTVSRNVTGCRYVGGVVGLNIGTVTNCYNSGSITGTVTLGGVVGYNDGSVINCCNSGSVTGNATDGYDYVGGVVGDSDGTVTDCINSGAVSGYRCVGDVVGINGGTVKSCYNSGTVSCTSQTAGGVVGYNYSGASTTNCYYLSTTASAAYRTNNGTLTNVESKTSTQFASGEVTWLLTSGVTDGTQAWYQTLGMDSYPVLDSTHGTVYYTTTGCDGSTVTGSYSNSSVIHAGSSYDKSHRKMLIDTFINAIFLYDDKVVISFNYKEGEETITFADLKAIMAERKNGSDSDCSTAPELDTSFDTMEYRSRCPVSFLKKHVRPYGKRTCGVARRNCIFYRG
ncbi:MAG: hypothetical protein LUH13_03720 [Oscillospiraceae bacterium]|nr:hypothetical protein [Oscillospiraceae bacterium]